MLKQDIKLSVDAIVFSHERKQLQVLLIRRKNEPYKDMWAFPGGFVEDDEDLLPAACRELEEETRMKLDNMKQLCTVGTPGRDPRFRTVSVIYYTVTDAKKHKVQGADDAAEAQWFDIKAPGMAFDHGDILQQAIQTLNNE